MPNFPVPGNSKNSPDRGCSFIDLAAAADLVERVVGPFAAAHIPAPLRSSGPARVVDLPVAANEVLGVVSLSSAAHLLPVVLDLQVAAAADEALRVVGLRAAAGRPPCVFESRLEVVGATDPRRPVVSVDGARLAVNALVLQVRVSCCFKIHILFL